MKTRYTILLERVLLGSVGCYAKAVIVHTPRNRAVGTLSVDGSTSMSKRRDTLSVWSVTSNDKSECTLVVVVDTPGVYNQVH